MREVQQQQLALVVVVVVVGVVGVVVMLLVHNVAVVSMALTFEVWVGGTRVYTSYSKRESSKVARAYIRAGWEDVILRRRWKQHVANAGA